PGVARQALGVAARALRGPAEEAPLRRQLRRDDRVAVRRGDPIQRGRLLRAQAPDRRTHAAQLRGGPGEEPAMRPGPTPRARERGQMAAHAQVTTTPAATPVARNYEMARDLGYDAD